MGRPDHEYPQGYLRPITLPQQSHPERDEQQRGERRHSQDNPNVLQLNFRPLSSTPPVAVRASALAFIDPPAETSLLPSSHPFAVGTAR
jgi:hypothetical protein